MFKKSLKGLVVIMVFALIGITSIQFIWINNTWKESENLLNNRVKQCLNDIDQQLNNLKNFQFITEQFNSKNKGDSLRIVVVEEESNFRENKSSNIDIQVVSESHVTRTNDFDKDDHLMDSMHKAKIVSWSSKANMEMPDVNEFLERITEEFKFIDSEKDVRIDSAKMVEIITKNFTANNLTDDYLWALKDSKTEELKYASDQFESNFSKTLFANDIVQPKRYELQVYYPVSHLIWKKTGWMIFLSIVFTTIIMLVFILAMRQVKKHKKISDIKSDFLNNLTHEFKTPLASISLAGDTIIHPEVIKDKSKIKEYIGIIQSEKEKLNSHVERILELAALDKNKLRLNFERIDLQQVTLKCIRSFNLLCSQRNIDISFNTNSELPIKADERFLPSIISNIIDNAIKYSNDDSKIEISAKESTNQIRLSVKDKGRGMTKKELRLIFDNFYRVETGNVHNTKGFGIGLSFVKKMMALHEGEIIIKSEVGSGTEVELIFNRYE